MSLLAPLLDVQLLDLERDRLSEQRRTLPEREALTQNRQLAAALDAKLAVLTEERARLEHSEHALGAEVAEVAAKAKEVEDHLYSGSVKISKELSALQHELDLHRARQAGIEERELELLESVETTDAEMRANRVERQEADATGQAIQAAIGRAEADIDAQLAVLAGKREELASGLPEPVLAQYDTLRANPRLAGRGAAPLADGSCGGCRIKLPVLDYTRMKAQPEDAVICCVHCKRVFVR